MTKNYQKLLSNGVGVRLKITATTGRPGARLQNKRPAESNMAVSFSARTEPEDAEKIQGEFNQFVIESAKDMSRLAGGLLTFQPVPIPVYEAKLVRSEAEATESALDSGVPGPGSTIAGNGEVVAPSPLADPEQVGGTSQA